VAGFTREAFESDRRTYNAVLYSLQTVGEAAIRLDKEEKRLGDPSEADIPLGALRRASFPKLVTSGGHSSVSEASCGAIGECWSPLVSSSAVCA